MKRHFFALRRAAIVRDRKDGFGRPANILLRPIDQFPDFLEMNDFIAEEKYIEERKRAVFVTQLNELLYYARDPERVRQYMQNRNRR